MSSVTDKPLVEISGQTSLSDTFGDIRSGIQKFRLWLYLARKDVSRKYDASFFGVGWITIEHFFVILGIGLLYSQVNSIDTGRFLVYYAVGLTTWSFIASIANESVVLFPNVSGQLKSTSNPVSIYVFKTLAKSTFRLCLQIPVVVFFVLVTSSGVGDYAIMSGVGFVLVLLCGACGSFTLAIIGARYRDFAGFVQSIIRLAFFITPVFWDVEQIGENEKYMNLNPFFHLIEVVREPLISNSFDMLHFYCVAGFLLALFTSAVCSMMLARHKIIYWL